MTTLPAGMPRMNLHQRAQHGLLTLSFGAALATGLVLGRPLGSGGSAAHAWHVAAGLGLLALFGYHLLYLTVRGYVESRPWASFPLRWSGDDFTAATAALTALLSGSAPPEADQFRPSQKALYWWTLAALALLGATGLGIYFWGRLGSLSLLPLFAAVHRSCALLLLAAVLWHLYGVLTWEGRWWPESSWITGVLDAEKAKLKIPGAWRRYLSEEAQRAEAAAAGPEEKARQRQSQEKAVVQEELEKGNLLALKERYVEALYHYRRALELYPDYSQARYNMARVLARMGENEMAREAYRQFLATDPFHPLANKAQEAIRELEAQGGQQ